MAKAKTKRGVAAKSRKAATLSSGNVAFCELPTVPEREFEANVGFERASLIRRSDKKWASGTNLHYFFSRAPARWAGNATQLATVRKAFKIWKDVGIGLTFTEVNDPGEAEIRIGFEAGAGSWSYIGRDVLGIGVDQRTMNFGWNIANDIDTPIHEIGHTLGFPHEHQNPNSGIVWDEEKVYADLAAPPNRWNRDKTFRNIIKKIDQADVTGSTWDPNSIMHYPFKAGLIVQPAKYKNSPLEPDPGLSPLDKKSVKEFYPALTQNSYKKLEPFVSQRLTLAAGRQENFRIDPRSTRSYNIGTFGASDTVMVLFEEVNGAWKYFAADDDSGSNRNARLTVRLHPRRKYALRVRLYYQDRAGDFGIMMW